MKFTKVDTMPGRRLSKKSLKPVFDEFMNMNVKIAKVEFNDREYKNASVAYNVLTHAVKRHCVPIKVHFRNNEIYFERRDI